MKLLVMTSSLALLAAGAGAATVDWYYLAPTVVSNPHAGPHPAIDANFERLPAVTAKLSFDPDLAPGGTLRNLEIIYEEDDWTTGGDDTIDINASVLTGLQVSCGSGSEDCASGGNYISRRIKFDADGNLADVRLVEGAQTFAFVWTAYSLNLSGARVIDEGAGNYYAIDERANWVLEKLGYQAGTPEYEALYCGSWAPAPHDGCFGEDHGEKLSATVWNDYAVADTALLFSSFGDFTEAFGRIAQTNRPASYMDIAPIPLPAPVLALLGGLAGFGWLRWRTG